MQAENKFLNQGPEFWANVKLISQKIGYTERKTKAIKVPTEQEIVNAYKALGLDITKISEDGKLSPFGNLLLEYFAFRAEFLTNYVKPNLQTLAEAKVLHQELKLRLEPTCPEPMNKQKGDKQGPAYLTAMVNMLIESESKGYDCNYDPKELTSFTHGGFPIRSLSRRVDGSFPTVVNPIAIWEIKEYYFTTTFGSRIADGVYETQLDGYELKEVREHLNKDVYHYLIIDDYNTWWNMGRSYLCRICDILHMGLVTEVLFGKEIVERIPVIAKVWIEQYEKEQR